MENVNGEIQLYKLTELQNLSKIILMIKSFKFFLLLLLFFLTFVSCESSKNFIDTLLSDYFPLETGIKWTYVDSSENEVAREVVRDTIIGNESAYVVEMGGEIELWGKNSDELSFYVKKILHRGDYTYTAEESFVPVLYLPPLDGYSSEDSTFKICLLLDDTAFYYRKLETGIKKIEGNRYRFHMSLYYENIGFEDSTTEFIERTYILAPDTGPVYIKVRRVVNQDTTVEEFNLLKFER